MAKLFPLLLLLTLPLTAFASPSSDYADALLAQMAKMPSELPQYTAVAEQAAAALASGKTLWLWGDRGFVLEGLNRAGGMMAAKDLRKPELVQAGDVVLWGRFALPQTAEQMSEHFTLFGQIKARRPFLIILTPEWLQAGSSNWAPAPPVSPEIRAPLLSVRFWTLTAEIVSALTRLGKMPPMYQTVMVPGGRERNAPHLKRQWDEPVAPVRAGLLGREYLAKVANSLRSLKTTQAEGFAQAGKLALETERAGHVVWYASLGHLLPELSGLPGDPNLAKPLKIGPGPEKLAEFVKAGDLILYVGYYEPYGPWVEKAHEIGAKIVTVVSGTPERRAEDMGADLNIKGCWAFGDAVVEVPGYDIKMLPPSGVVQAAAYYMLMAQIRGAN
ncbi:MAG: hypothetical protein ABFE08_11555 [Armatimonadia bacterium]